MAGRSSVPGRSVISKISAIVSALREGRAHTLTEIAVRAGLPLSTVHRLVNELAAWGLLVRDDDGGFRMSTVLGEVGGRDGSPMTANRLRERVAPVMDDLFHTAETQVRAGFLVGEQVAYFEKVHGHLPVSAPSTAARLPAHATALGKALLAFSSRSLVEVVVARGLKQYTARTVTRPEQLRSALLKCRADGVALCDRELDEEWCGLAAPVFGPGGVVVAALELRLHDPVRHVSVLRAPLKIAAACLSRELANAHPDPDPGPRWWAAPRDLVSAPRGGARAEPTSIGAQLGLVGRPPGTGMARPPLYDG